MVRYEVDFIEERNSMKKLLVIALMSGLFVAQSNAKNTAALNPATMETKNSFIVQRKVPVTGSGAVTTSGTVATAEGAMPTVNYNTGDINEMLAQLEINIENSKLIANNPQLSQAIQSSIAYIKTTLARLNSDVFSDEPAHVQKKKNEIGGNLYLLLGLTQQ